MGTYRKKIKSDRILAAVLMLALLAGGVGLGIHLLHKDALAQVTYIVEILNTTPNPDEWLDNADVDFSFDGRQTWVATTFIGNGRYKYQVDNYKTTWHIRVDEPEILPPVWIAGPATVAFYHWEVQTAQ